MIEYRVIVASVNKPTGKKLGQKKADSEKREVHCQNHSQKMKNEAFADYHGRELAGGGACLLGSSGGEFGKFPCSSENSL